MVERNSDQVFSCKLCPEEKKDTLCIANCIGCKDSFCIIHLIEHHRQVSNDFEDLNKRHVNINDESLTNIYINQHLEYIDKWQHNLIELIQQNTKHIKEKIQSIFNVYKDELRQRHINIGKEVNSKRGLTPVIENDIKDLSRQMQELEKDLQNINKLFHQITQTELNYLVDKCRQPINTIDWSIKWNYLRDIKLDSTYAYMAASNQHIYLGWKNRIVVYHIDGTKQDETRLEGIHQYGELCDLIWSSVMGCFVILCRKSVFVHYPLNSRVEILLNKTLFSHENNFISITTYGNKLFLLNEKFLDIWQLDERKVSLNRSIATKLIVKNESDETISSIRVNGESLAMLIQNNKANTWRIDLFSIEPFQRINIGTSFDYFEKPNLGLFMPLNNNIYLFMNWETKLMRMISSTGLNQIIDYNAYNACLLDSQNMIVVNYMTHLKVYAI